MKNLSLQEFRVEEKNGEVYQGAHLNAILLLKDPNMSESHIAQINIARMPSPLSDPIMAEFVAQLPPINALADVSLGFVWRLQSESGDATSIKVYDDDMIIVNLTVGESVDALWWVPVGQYPSTEEGKERLDNLRKQGDTTYAFHLRIFSRSLQSNGVGVYKRSER